MPGSGLRGAVVLYVVIAGVIWNLLLTGHSMGYTPANMLLHVVVPVLALTDWLLVGRGQGTVRWWQPLAWLAYPAAVRRAGPGGPQQAGRRAPYYFLDPGSVGVGTVLLNICVLAGGLLGAGLHVAGVDALATVG